MSSVRGRIALGLLGVAALAAAAWWLVDARTAGSSRRILAAYEVPATRGQAEADARALTAGALGRLLDAGTRAALGGLLERAKLSRAVAASSPEDLDARYVPTPFPEALSALPATLPPAGALQRWQIPETDGTLAWNPVTGKLAVFWHGWIWVTDGQGSALRALWFEPDLQAEGRLFWSADGTKLWMRADGWRHWMSLSLSVEGPSRR